MSVFLLFLCLFFSSALGDNGGILQIHYPDISIEADANGSIILQSGADASVYMLPGPGGTVYYEGNDIMQLIKVINGLPPVWKEHSSVGFYRTAFGGDSIDVKLEAVDPDNQTLEYKVVAGTMPPGLHIDSNNSKITGTVPDADALYSFTVRATNKNDKYADAIFRMEIIERNQCLPTNPCRHGGTCQDMTGEVPYKCDCAVSYSGQNCEISCSSNSLGLQDSRKISDAMLSGFITHENFSASDGRIDSSGGSGKGWCGTNTNSWLQIDLGKEARLFAAMEQSYSSSYYTGSYQLSYSTNGTTFEYVHDLSTNSSSIKTFSGTSSSSKATATLPSPITARFVRFHPYSYSSSHYPCMRVDLYGCYIE